jgi:hypothetical protein
MEPDQLKPVWLHKDGTEQLVVFLPSDLAAWVKARAERLGVSVSQVVAEAVDNMITGQN